MYRIAIAGASTLLGKELKDAIGDSPLAAATFTLLDDETAQGQLDQVGDEITFIQPILSDAWDKVDFAFFCGSRDMTLKYWRDALRAGATVLDLSGALDHEPGVLVRAPWLETEAPPADLLTPATVPAHPAALALALLLGRIQQSAPVRTVAVTMLLPSSEFGQPAMDELHQQTVNLLSFQPLPRAVYDAQSAYNLLLGLGENARTSLPQTDARIRRDYASLGHGRLPSLALQTIAAPVFHGHTFSIAVELDRPADLAAIEEALGGEHVDLVMEDTDSPSNLAATGQNDVLVRLRPVQEGRNPMQSSRFWLWAATDNLRLSAQNALACALDLRRLRPQGTVQ
ncbi:MAG TPA: Asd/ArgC dimerization domain-containing protein [Terracidiphilus sp.]|nr:Asd/ArgC dimerization domain-containing protein [Terracidiphilus sp.]